MKHPRSSLEITCLLSSVFALWLAACDESQEPQDTSSERPSIDSPGSELDEELDWAAAGEADDCNVDALLPTHVSVRRVKNLLTGLAPTEAELEEIQQDPTRLREHVRLWVRTPEFRSKLSAFLDVTLQQANLDRLDYVIPVTDAEGIAGWGDPTELWDNLNESFVRTAMHIVEEGRPFNEISSTRTWMMTTAMMSYLIHADRYVGPDMRFYHEAFTAEGVTFDMNTPIDVQSEHATFYSSTPLVNEASGCTDPYDVVSRGVNAARALKRPTFTTFITGRSPNGSRTFCNTIRVPGFNGSDFSDWRPVEILPLGVGVPRSEQFFDAHLLRQMDTLPLEIERTGFFTTPSFLGGWRTNEENSFRVTTNQTLITGLGLAFEDSDTTTPLGDDGLAADHASPGTQCYSCHKNLDPMRNFFDVVFLPNTYAPRLEEDRLTVTPTFSFQGYSDEGTGLRDLGRILSEHPYFSTGWTQKLCMYANSKKCNEDDPEFTRVVQAFEDSNFDLEALFVELYSSPLVTGSSCAEGEEGDFSVVSIARFEHLCKVLETRLGLDDVCALNGNIEDLAAALPTANWSRGSTEPAQPTEPSLFYAAGEKSLCKEIAALVVDSPGSMLQTSNMEGSIDYIVETVMGVPPSDPRHGGVHELMTQHVDLVGEVDGAASQLRSAFVVACTSPFVTSTDL